MYRPIPMPMRRVAAAGSPGRGRMKPRRGPGGGGGIKGAFAGIYPPNPEAEKRGGGGGEPGQGTHEAARRPRRKRRVEVRALDHPPHFFQRRFWRNLEIPGEISNHIVES